MTNSSPERLDAFVGAARALLGREGWSEDAERLEPWLTDWRSRYTGRAIALCSPANTKEVAAIVRLCAKHRVPIVPQGGNSSMSGGATPDETGNSILLSMRRMDRIRTFDPSQGRITCEAGVILETLQETVAQAGLRFPLTLGGKGSATVGGLVATNAGGTQVLQHGTMRAQVIGIEAVLANGDALDLLANLKKDNRGFDLKQLLIGSEGTLGIVTAASLRLLPAVGVRKVTWIGVNSPTTAHELLTLAREHAGPYLEGFELLPDSSLAAVLDYLPVARRPIATPSPWHVLIEVASSFCDEDRMEAALQTLFEAAASSGLADAATLAQNEAQAEAFWTLRDNISPAERARGPAMQHDVSVPVEDMAAFIEHAIPAVERRFAGTRALAFGHLGDGNVHFHVQAPAGASAGLWETTEGKEISAFVHDLVTEWKGSISAEHGIGQMKIDELERLHDPVALATMRAVKHALDPLNILNPGKLVRPPPEERRDNLAPDDSKA